jgi:hypothetical protein
MPKLLPATPFEIPLNDGEMILMGKIAVLWGQIDESFNSVLRWVLRIEEEVFESLLGTQLIASRLAHLKAAAPNAKRQEVRAKLLEVCELLTEVIPDRNAAMHGCWGRYVLDPTFTRFRIGIYNHQKPKVRFFAEQLPGLYTRLVSVLTLLSELLMYSAEENPAPVTYRENKTYFAPQSPDERAAGVRFERGDKVVHVESVSPRWRSR